MTIEKSIVICEYCNGSGKIEIYDLACDIICKKCEGTGRLLKIVESSYEKLNKEHLKLRLMCDEKLDELYNKAMIEGIEIPKALNNLENDNRLTLQDKFEIVLHIANTMNIRVHDLQQRLEKLEISKKYDRDGQTLLFKASDFKSEIKLNSEKISWIKDSLEK